jgi:hypothetical protein
MKIGGVEFAGGREEAIELGCTHGSAGKEAPPEATKAGAETGFRQAGEREARLVAPGIELLGLREGDPRGTDQAEGLLALAEFQPKQEMSGIAFDGLLKKF